MKPAKAIIEKFMLNFLAVFIGVQLSRHWIEFTHWDFARGTLMLCLMAAVTVTLVDLWRYWKSI